MMMATIDPSNRRLIETIGDNLRGLYHNQENTLLTKIVRGINMSEGHDEASEGEMNEAYSRQELQDLISAGRYIETPREEEAQEQAEEESGDENYPASWNGPVRRHGNIDVSNNIGDINIPYANSTDSWYISNEEQASDENERISYQQRQRWISSPFAPLIPYQYITLGGVGGVGSWAAVILAKMGFNNVSVYDMDGIEGVNIGGQLYPYSSIGSNKADIIIQLCQGFSASMKNWESKEKFDENSEAKPISIASFDNMEGRKLMFEKWKELAQSEDNRFEEAIDEELELTEARYSGLSSVDKTMFDRVQEEERILKYAFIDMRMLAELIQIIIITPDTIDQYEQYLFDDDDVEPEDCSYRATTFAGAMAGSLVGTAVANVISGRPIETFNEFQLPIML